MDIKRKLEIVEQAIRSISQHDDADSVVLCAALERVCKMASTEADAVRKRQEVLVAQSVPKTEAKEG